MKTSMLTSSVTAVRRCSSSVSRTASINKKMAIDLFARRTWMWFSVEIAVNIKFYHCNRSTVSVLAQVTAWRREMCRRGRWIGRSCQFLRKYLSTPMRDAVMHTSVDSENMNAKKKLKFICYSPASAAIYCGSVLLGFDGLGAVSAIVISWPPYKSNVKPKKNERKKLIKKSCKWIKSKQKHVYLCSINRWVWVCVL